MGYWPFLLSFCFHLSLGASLYFWKEKKVQLAKKTQKKAKKLSLGQAIRVDVVAMPKLTLKELRAKKKKGATSLPPKPQVKKKKKVKAGKKNTSLKPSKSQKKFSSFLQRLSQTKIKPLGKKQQKKRKKERLSKTDKKLLEGLIVEGNKLSQGSKVLGKGKNTLEIRQGLEAYVGNMVTAIRSYWKLPSYLLEKKVTCQIRVYVSENGDLIKTEIYKKSGIDEFDQRAVLAIEKASPFGVPSSVIRSKLSDGEVLLGFPL